MPVYRIDYTRTEYRQCTVEADSESAARQVFIDGDEDNDHLREVSSEEISQVREEQPCEPST